MLKEIDGDEVDGEEQFGEDAVEEVKEVTEEVIKSAKV